MCSIWYMFFPYVLFLLTSVVSAAYLSELYYLYAPFATMEAINPATVNITRDNP